MNSDAKWPDDYTLTNVECGSCGELMRLVPGSETMFALKCVCGEYFYALHRGMMAIGSETPKNLDEAFKALHM